MSIKGIIINGWKQGIHFNNFGLYETYLDNLLHGITYEKYENKLSNMYTYKNDRLYGSEYMWYLNGTLEEINNIRIGGISYQFYDDGKIEAISYTREPVCLNL